MFLPLTPFKPIQPANPKGRLFIYQAGPTVPAGSQLNHHQLIHNQRHYDLGQPKPAVVVKYDYGDKPVLNGPIHMGSISLSRQKISIQKHPFVVKSRKKEKKPTRFLIWINGLSQFAHRFVLLCLSVRFKLRQYQLITTQKAKSLLFKRRLLRRELQQMKTELAILLNTLNEKNARISSITDELAVLIDQLREKDTLIHSLTAELGNLSQIQRKSREQHQSSESRQDLLNARLHTNDDWDDFRQRFEQLHPGFFVKIKKQFRDISPAEERFLALSQLQVDTRQMSRMLGISPESIRKTKYRLRKKLGIQGDSPFVEILADERDELVT